MPMPVPTFLLANVPVPVKVRLAVSAVSMPTSVLLVNTTAVEPSYILSVVKLLFSVSGLTVMVAGRDCTNT